MNGRFFQRCFALLMVAGLGVAILLTFIMFFESRALAAPAFLTFTPEAVSGDVIYWTTSSGRWLHVRIGVPIPEKTLVQVGEASQLVLRIDSQSGFPDRPGKSLVADINAPMVFRLERDLIRSAKINRQVFKVHKIESESNAVVSSVVDKIVHANFREAFADIPGRGKNRIKLTLPAKENHIHVSEFPTTIPVSWEVFSKEADPQVQILMWPEGEVRGPPVTITKDAVISVPIVRPGTWLLQVASMDWKAKSGVRKFFVHALESSAQNQMITASLPDNFTYAANQFPVKLPISWEFMNQAGVGSRDFEVIVSRIGATDEKETIYRVLGSRSTVLTFVKPGKFIWYVREIPSRVRDIDETADKINFRTSIKSSLTITKAADFFASPHEPGLRGPLASQIKSGKSATIFLDKLP